MFSIVQSAHTGIEAFARDFDPSVLTREQAIVLVEVVGSIRRLSDGIFAKAAKRIDDTSEEASESDRDAAALCARVLGTSVSETRRAILTAKKLEQLPAADAAVRAGVLSARQAQMIADAATINPSAEQALLMAAERGLVPLKDACIAARAAVENGRVRARRQNAARSFRMWNSDDGMLEGRFRLAPEVGGHLKAVIDTETQAVFRARGAESAREPLAAYAADALLNAVLGTSSVSKSTKVSVHVLIDHAALVRGDVGDGEKCEIAGVGPVSVDWVRQLLGSAFVTAVIKKGRDVATVAHLGRHIPAELQTAMIAGGRECVVEGCDGRGYLERDHCEIDHARGGPTAYWNLAWMCYVHHLRKTKGWQLGPPDPVTGKRSLSPPDELGIAV